jgi:hypothetical protein
MCKMGERTFLLNSPIVPSLWSKLPLCHFSETVDYYLIISHWLHAYADTQLCTLARARISRLYVCAYAIQ